LNEDEARLTGEVGLLDGDIRSREEAMKSRVETIAVKRVEREEAAVSLAQLESEMSAMRAREKSWHDNLAMFRASLNGYLDEMNRLTEEASLFGGRREKLLSDIAELEGSITALRAEKDGLKDSLIRLETEEKDVSQRMNSMRAQIAGMEKELANGHDTAHEMAMRAQQMDFQEQSVKERMLQKYNIDVTVADVASVTVPEIMSEGGEAAAPVLDIEALKAEIQVLSKRCDSFGGVNLLAIEEFEELKGRFQFLTKQQADLLEAKTSLEQTIRKINKTTRELFIDTFTKVNEQFRQYFKVLFNGGEAQLVLMDPENALESGIEIIARPPGKKLQTISLLSGGEKTMTAIALIFAVFKVNPSPFCVLDEIDAALDEANVDRFSLVLQEFAKISQFIVITHNKKTMKHANVMYGVTMQQRGISKVVSVKFSEYKAENTPAPAAVQQPQQIQKAEEPQVEEFAGV
jgi:chromosome segregation protein